MRRLLVPVAALLWGLQISFLVPTLALILVALYGANLGEVGWVLAVYNGSGFVASLLVPAWADRRRDYLRPLLMCGVFTLALALVLARATSLPWAVVALVVLGGPAGAGTGLFFAHLRHAGASGRQIVNTRAILSVAWVAGPPAATLIIATLGNRAILFVIAGVAALASLTTVGMLRERRTGRRGAEQRGGSEHDDQLSLRKRAMVLIVGAFVLLQAGNASITSIMTLFVTDTLGQAVLWAGAALGLAAALEIPALVLMGRLTARYSNLQLVLSGCVAGVLYYVAAAFVTDPVLLLVLQPLNAWTVAAVAGVGMTLFQQLIPRPGLATGLYMNTRRIGAIVSGPVIALGAVTALGNRMTFLACAALTLLALAGIAVAAGRTAQRSG